MTTQRLRYERKGKRPVNRTGYIQNIYKQTKSTTSLKIHNKKESDTQNNVIYYALMS